jgi:hypothetical protein
MNDAVIFAFQNWHAPDATTLPPAGERGKGIGSLSLARNRLQGMQICAWGRVLRFFGSKVFE